MPFGNVPPEINSARLFYGCGSESMARAATAWDELAMDIRQAAAHCCAVAATLAEGLHGAVAIAIGRALAPYIAWLNAVADQAANAATQAAAAVSAHEMAMAATVNPDVIIANRVRLTSLCATNCLAQVAPAIAHTEAEYDGMWAHDAEAMYAYARASAKACALAPFALSSLTVDATGLTHPDVNIRRSSRKLASTPAVIAASRQVITTIPQALQELSSSPQTTLDVHLLPITAELSKLGSLAPASEVAIKNLNTVNRGMMLLRAVALSSPQQRRVAADLGGAPAVGTLSVPSGWLMETAADSAVDEPWIWEPLRLVDVTGAPQGHRTQISGTRGAD
jgi:PPE-repeat protein